MANTSRKKTLPLAVLAAPALAFCSLTFAAAPAMAVQAEEIQEILAEDGIDTVLLVAPTAIEPEGDDVDAEQLPAGSLQEVTSDDIVGDAFIAEDGQTYLLDPFELAGSEQYLELELTVPSVIEQQEDDGSEAVRPTITLSAAEVQVGETVTISIDNLGDVLESNATDNYEVNVSGDVSTGESFGTFAIAEGGTDSTYDFTIPDSVDTESGEISVGPESRFAFRVSIVLNPDDEVYRETTSDYETIYVVAGETPDDEEIPGDEETPDDGDENPDDVDENANEDDQDETPGDEEPVEPALSVESDEILVEDFVGDPEEGAGVTHNLTGMAPNTTFEYSVETPANIQPFSSSVLSDENGAAEFSIYGENADNPSVYVGDYTTTVTYEDEDGETQELTTSFSVVEASNDNGDVGGEEDDEVTPVVDTEEPAEPVADTDNDQDEAAPAPAVGGADAQLADTGANGTSLMWIAGGLLALGGAFVIYANRGRLFGRKN